MTVMMKRTRIVSACPFSVLILVAPQKLAHYLNLSWLQCPMRIVFIDCQKVEPMSS